MSDYVANERFVYRLSNGFQINVLPTISESIPKMTKLCPTFTSHVIDDKMEYPLRT